MYHSHVTQLDSMLQRLFEGIYAHRYRDVCEMVRGVTTESIGRWCTMLPSLYLTDHYLKFVAWSLCDRVRSHLCLVPGFKEGCGTRLQK